jgi:hypothetical protein
MITLILSAALAAAQPTPAPMDHSMHHPMAGTPATAVAPVKAKEGCCPPPCCKDMADMAKPKAATVKPAQ